MLLTGLISACPARIKCSTSLYGIMQGNHNPRPNGLTFAAFVVTTPLAAQEAEAGYFTVPFDSEAFFRPVGPGGVCYGNPISVFVPDAGNRSCPFDPARPLPARPAYDMRLRG
jgi:hypothetical protein